MRVVRIITIASCLSAGSLLFLGGCDSGAKKEGVAQERDPAVVAAEQKATQDAMKNMNKKK